MNDADTFVHSFLEHAGRIYDPVKAHAYYERTKKLKGKRPKLRTQKQKEGWSYVQSRVKELQKTELTSAASKNKAVVEQLRATGAQRRQALSDKIKTLEKSVQGAEREKIVSELKSSLEQARNNYKKARESIKKKYEATLQREFDAIRTNVH